MIDLKFDIDENGLFDLSIEDGDLVIEDGFDTTIWLSLFTDARADESQVLVQERRSGWLGNLVSDIEDRQLGGYLWLVDQRRLTQSTLNECIDYCEKALQWLIDDEICSDVQITGYIVPRTGIELEVTIISKIGVVSNNYVKIWQLTGV